MNDSINASILIDLFDTPDKRTTAINSLQALRVHPGFILLQQLLEKDIKAFETQILDNPNLSIEEQNELKKDRARFMYFRDLPKSIVAELAPKQAQTERSDDIYE